MKQKLVLFGFFLFGILYFSNKKGVKKMVPTIVLKYKKLFMGLAVGLVAYAVLHKDVEEFVATDVPVPCYNRKERGLDICNCQDFFEERCDPATADALGGPCQCASKHMEGIFQTWMANGRLAQCHPDDVINFAKSQGEECTHAEKAALAADEAPGGRR